MKLTTEQSREVCASGTPTEVVDETARRVYYLLAEEQFQKVRQLLAGVEQIDPSLYEFRDA